MPEPVDSRHTGKTEVPVVQLGCLPVRPETLGPALLTVSPKTRPVSALETPDQLSDSVCQVLPERFNITSADDFFGPRPPHRALEPFPENRPEGQFQDHDRLCALKNQRPEIAGVVVRHSAARIRVHPLEHDVLHVLRMPQPPAGDRLNPVDLDEHRVQLLVRSRWPA